MCLPAGWFFPTTLVVRGSSFLPALSTDKDNVGKWLCTHPLATRAVVVALYHSLQISITHVLRRSMHTYDQNCSHNTRCLWVFFSPGPEHRQGQCWKMVLHRPSCNQRRCRQGWAGVVPLRKIMIARVLRRNMHTYDQNCSHNTCCLCGYSFLPS